MNRRTQGGEHKKCELSVIEALPPFKKHHEFFSLKHVCSNSWNLKNRPKLSLTKATETTTKHSFTHNTLMARSLFLSLSLPLSRRSSLQLHHYMLLFSFSWYCLMWTNSLACSAIFNEILFSFVLCIAMYKSWKKNITFIGQGEITKQIRYFTTTEATKK